MNLQECDTERMRPKMKKTYSGQAIEHSRTRPIGAEALADGGVHFQVWAPKAKSVAVELSERASFDRGSARCVQMEPERDGYYSVYVAEAKPGMLYKLKLDGKSFPDPASRFQPEGPHGPSQIVDCRQFQWTDEAWRGVRREGQAIYEMHIGTYTKEGTWDSARRELPELKNLGVTVLEVMPVAEFPGRFGWGYDGVGLFAPTRLYGKPDDFRAFVNEAHRLDLGVILDVVYNHVGPDGNYLNHFSEDYFSDRYPNEWGKALNFDGKNSGPVREFFVTNARYWIEEFHLDGLRLDATHQIFDRSKLHILSEISQETRKAGGNRSLWLVGENERQESKFARPVAKGGYGLDALWNDDFHHTAKVALTGRSEGYYGDYMGSPQEFISALKRGFLYQGQWYTWQKAPRGKPVAGLQPEQFVCFLQNHDQVANSLRGSRFHELSGPGRCRALTALLLLGPNTPMLFQGQEFSASAPFLFFADHKPDLAKMVAKGRREFLNQFPSIAAFKGPTPEPGSEVNFRRCVLDLSEREQHAAVYQLHKDLLRMRREDPVFAKPCSGGIDGAVLGRESFVIRFFGKEHGDRLLLVNLAFDQVLAPAPEPLLAPADDQVWELVWSSESAEYGGSGTPPFKTDQVWHLPGHSTLVLRTNAA
jgi:maltooligosyltrehalose trehalohydrolase